jgi:hypothetical protein
MPPANPVAGAGACLFESSRAPACSFKSLPPPGGVWFASSAATDGAIGYNISWSGAGAWHASAEACYFKSSVPAGASGVACVGFYNSFADPLYFCSAGAVPFLCLAYAIKTSMAHLLMFGLSKGDPSPANYVALVR